LPNSDVFESNTKSGILNGIPEPAEPKPEPEPFPSHPFLSVSFSLPL
jgi:hypothetical protein